MSLNVSRFRAIAVLTVLVATPALAELRTHNVVLITVDGLRHQELFSGVDPLLLENKERAGIKDLDRLREQYWRPTATERREALLPFFWGTLARQGIVIGNKARGSRVTLTNPVRISYPGYAEILTGQAQLAIVSNDPIRMPRETLLEFARRKLNLPRTQVAAFASWNVFNAITARNPDSIFTNAGYQPVPPDIATPEMAVLNALQMQMLTPWDSVRHDAITAGLALAYVKTYQPRLLYLALGETDDWAHDRRYDRVIHAARFFDDRLRDLWSLLQSTEHYRDRTTLVITTDHGRGSTLENWTSHRGDIDGAEDVWIAVIGPDTPNRGEVAPTPALHTSNVAGTVLKLLGLDTQEFNPQAGAPISLAFKSP